MKSLYIIAQYLGASRRETKHFFDLFIKPYIIMSESNQQNEENIEELVVAAENGDVNEIMLFLKKGININALHSEYGSALHQAAGNGHKELVSILLDNGANVNIQHDGEYGNGETPLHSIAEAAWRQVDIDVASLLLDNGADINSQDNRGRTPLLEAVNQQELSDGNDNIMFVSLLLEKGADVNIADNDGNTPLMRATQIYSGDNSSYVEKVVKLLIKYGAHVNAQDESGNTPLHYAAFDGSQETVNTLLVMGADISKKNNQGQTALDKLMKKDYSMQNVNDKKNMNIIKLHEKKINMQKELVDRRNNTTRMKTLKKGKSNNDKSIFPVVNTSQVTRKIAEYLGPQEVRLKPIPKPNRGGRMTRRKRRSSSSKHRKSNRSKKTKNGKNKIIRNTSKAKTMKKRLYKKKHYNK